MPAGADLRECRINWLCRWHLYDLLANRNAWWAPGKTLELRRRLKPYWQVRECVVCIFAAAIDRTDLPAFTTVARHIFWHLTIYTFLVDHCGLWMANAGAAVTATVHISWLDYGFPP